MGLQRSYGFGTLLATVFVRFFERLRLVPTQKGSCGPSWLHCLAQVATIRHIWDANDGAIQMRPVNPYPQRSFTLVEVMVTMALALVLMLGLFASSTMARRARIFTREREIAREAARSPLEQIISTA